MPDELKVLLVSPDLMATSRIAGLCREAGATLETLRALTDIPHGGPHDVILLDLQAIVLQDPVLIDETIALIRAEQCNAEWALIRQFEEAANQFDAIECLIFRHVQAAEDARADHSGA